MNGVDVCHGTTINMWSFLPYNTQKALLYFFFPFFLKHRKLVWNTWFHHRHRGCYAVRNFCRWNISPFMKNYVRIIFFWEKAARSLGAAEKHRCDVVLDCVHSASNDLICALFSSFISVNYVNSSSHAVSEIVTHQKCVHLVVML